MTETIISSMNTDSALWKILQSLELVDIRTVRWHSELQDFHAQKISDFDPVFSVDFRADEDTLQFRWAFDSTLSSPSGQPVANLGLTLLQTFAVIDTHANRKFSHQLIHEFAEKTAVISIIPFVREAIQTMTVRLGLPAVTLGLIRAGAYGPQSFSVRNADSD